MLQFYTSVKSEGKWRTLPGAEVAALLKKKLRSDLNLLTYPVLDVDTAICQNNCSGNLLYVPLLQSYDTNSVGHGVCDQYSRRCICKSFWMENPFKASNSGDYNCGKIVQLSISSLNNVVTTLFLARLEHCLRCDCYQHHLVDCSGAWLLRCSVLLGEKLFLQEVFAEKTSQIAPVRSPQRSFSHSINTYRYAFFHDRKNVC